jgi:hypothetical protein
MAIAPDFKSTGKGKCATGSGFAPCG